MTRNNNKKNSGGLFAGYCQQVVIAPVLSVVLFSIFLLIFGFDENLLLTNILVLAVWLILVFFAFLRRQHGEVWRDYRWIIAPSVLILLFLFDTSWAQSTLSTSGVKKSVFKVIYSGALQFHAEYPSQILYDDTEPSEIRVWTSGIVTDTELDISANGLLFAVKPPSDVPLVWSKKLTITFDATTTATTLLVQPSKPPEPDSRTYLLNLSSGGKDLETQNWTIIVESKRDSQLRGWKMGFLETGGTIVSLITAVFVGIKQLEEEKKRQKAELVKQAITTYDTNLKNDISKMLKEHLELTNYWNEWDKALQDQFRNKYSLSVEKDLWSAIAIIPLMEIPSIIENLLQICERIFNEKDEKKISAISQLQSAIEKKEQNNLKSFLKEYPESGVFVEQIAKIIAIEPLSIDTEHTPRQGQLHFLAKQFDGDKKISAWLAKQQIFFSPFLDTSNVFTLLPTGNNMLIETAATRFIFDNAAYQERLLFFLNFWDLGAGLFEYLKQFPPKLKQDTFIILLTQDMLSNTIEKPSNELFFHALAESWFWEITENWSTYYSLTSPQRGLTGRLLCWHGNSPDVILNRFEQSLGGQNRNKSAQKMFLQIMDWLKNSDPGDLQMGELKSLAELRPISKKHTLLIDSAGAAIKLDALPFFNRQDSWPKKQSWNVVNFQISASRPQLVSTIAITQQCNERVNLSSNNLIQGFDELFTPHDEKPAEQLLAEKANGSPGKMVRLGQKLLLQHVEKYPPDELLHIEDLEALE